MESSHDKLVIKEGIDGLVAGAVSEEIDPCPVIGGHRIKQTPGLKYPWLPHYSLPYFALTSEVWSRLR